MRLIVERNELPAIPPAPSTLVEQQEGTFFVMTTSSVTLATRGS